MDGLRSLLGLILRLLVERLLARRTAFARLAFGSLLLSGAAFSTPLWQFALDYFLPNLNSACDQFPPWLAGALFLVLSFVFAYLSERHAGPQANEVLIHTPVISDPVQIGSSWVSCYCGSVEALSDAELVITSEDQELRLGSIAGTSVSGRIRRMAAAFDSKGQVVVDHLSDFLVGWKAGRPPQQHYPLGTWLVAPPFNAARAGIRSILLAVALEKRDSGQHSVSEKANAQILDAAISYCEQHNLKSLFVPVFGLGSGRVGAEVIGQTLGPLAHLLKAEPNQLRVYVGTYRTADAARVLARLASLA